MYGRIQTLTDRRPIIGLPYLVAPRGNGSLGRRQYFLHNFLIEQPDLNMHNSDVQDAILGTMRFWLERGVDGFRLDTVNYYFHDQDLRNNPPNPCIESGHLPAETYGWQVRVFRKPARKYQFSEANESADG